VDDLFQVVNVKVDVDGQTDLEWLAITLDETTVAAWLL